MKHGIGISVEEANSQPIMLLQFGYTYSPYVNPEALDSMNATANCNEECIHMSKSKQMIFLYLGFDDVMRPME